MVFQSVDASLQTGPVILCLYLACAYYAPLSLPAELYLWGNSLTGSADFTLPPGLLYLYLSFNQLTGFRSSLPGTLEELGLDANRMTDLGILTADLSSLLPRLAILRLENNSLPGPLPGWSSFPGGLRRLGLDSNSFYGPIPAEWSAAPDGINITLHDNELTGMKRLECASQTRLRAACSGEGQGDQRIRGSEDQSCYPIYIPSHGQRSPESTMQARCRRGPINLTLVCSSSLATMLCVARCAAKLLLLRTALAWTARTQQEPGTAYDLLPTPCGVCRFPPHPSTFFSTKPPLPTLSKTAAILATSTLH